MEKKCNLLLREYTQDSFWLTYFWKDKSFGLLKTHDIVVLLQPEYGMLEKGNTIAIPVQKHRQIVFDIFLGEIVRQLVKIQHSLRNLQSVVIDSTIRVLSQAEFFRKPTPNREKSQACLDYSEVRRRKTKLESEIRSSNFGTASMALCKIVLYIITWCRVLCRGG